MADFVSEPDWTPSTGRRVLIEATEWRDREALATALRRRGYATAACPGPEGADGRCPLAGGAGCRTSEEADVIVHTLGPSDLRNVETLESHRRRHPSTPTVVEIADRAAAQAPERYAGLRRVPHGASAEAIADAVDAIATQELPTR